METIRGLAFRALNGGRTYEQKRRQNKEKAHAEEQTRVLEQRPAPLPKLRKNLSQTSLSTHPQPTSPLFAKLPPKIRQRIYRYILGDHVLHLTHISKRVVHRQLDITRDCTDEEPPTGTIPLPMPPTVKWADEHNRIPESGEFSSLPISFLQTCHAAYAEALPILYNSNTFSLASPLVLLYMKDYMLRPQHFAEIRNLQLVPWVYFGDPDHYTGKVHEPFDADTWPRFWKLVAEMKLQSLGLWLEYWGADQGCSIEADWMKPVLQVHGVEKVGVHIQYREGPWSWKRVHEIEDAVEKAWTTS